MIRAKKHFLKTCHAKVGGGGFHCDCCMPPNRLTRKKFLRRMRRVYNQQISKLVQADLE